MTQRIQSQRFYRGVLGDLVVKSREKTVRTTIAFSISLLKFKSLKSKMASPNVTFTWDASSAKPTENSSGWEPLFTPRQKRILCGLYTVDTLQNLAAFLGNFFVILAMVKFKRLRSNTYYYLLNLAVADCIGSLCSPLEGAYVLYAEKHHAVLSDNTGKYTMGDNIMKNNMDDNRATTLCVAYIWYLLFVHYQNITCMALMTVDKWISIEYPLFHKARVTDKLVRLLITLSWVAGVVFTSLSIFARRGPVGCFLSDPGPPRPFFVPSLTVSLGVAAFCYGRIVTIALKTSTRGRAERFKLATTIGLVTGVYHSLYIAAIAVIASFWTHHTSAPSSVILIKIGRVIVDFNRIANPIIYGYRDGALRAGLRRVVGLGRRQVHPSWTGSRDPPPAPLALTAERPSHAIKWISGEAHLIQTRSTSSEYNRNKLR